MDVEAKLRLKTMFLRTVLHLQGLPAAGTAALHMGMCLRAPVAAMADIMGDQLRKKDIYTIDPHHPIYALARPLAHKAGVNLTQIYKCDESYGDLRAAVYSVGKVAAINVSEDFLQMASWKPDLVKAVLAHELAHVMHRDGDHRITFEQLQTQLRLVMGIAGGAGLFSAVVAPSLAAFPLLAAIAAEFSAHVAIPLLGGMLSRNQEYRADIDSVRLTDDPEALMAFFDHAEEPYRPSQKPYSKFNPYFGLSHPTLNQRRAMLCRIFNIESAKGSVIATQPEAKIGAVHPAVTGPS